MGAFARKSVPDTRTAPPLAGICRLPAAVHRYLFAAHPRKPVQNGWLPSACLASQIMLFGFAWFNRRVPGMSILICGIALNLAVMTANSGFMPISPQTASRLISEERLLDIQPGSRLGPKDILLHPQDTRFEWLADRFLPPSWFPYQVAFSLGDVLIAIGAFWMLASPGSSSNLQIEVHKHDSPNNISK